MIFPSKFLILFPLIGALGLSSCQQVGDVVMEKAMSTVADGQIMLISREPETFGYVRLVSRAQTYPSLGEFVEKRGLPDYLAETHTRGQEYFILYYLRERKAYACRSLPGKGQRVQFSGPYPITDREYKLLDDFRRDPSRQPKIQGKKIS